MFELFSDMPQAAKFVVAFVVVLALIGLTAWLVRRFGSSRLGTAARGRQPRLAVIDAANVDGRRRLVLIRRDNVEHLMMIGGPNDLVVEPNIVRASARDVREPGRELRAPEPRPVPVAENGGSWPLQPAVEPPPVATPQPRPLRGNVPEEPWVAAEPPLPFREPPPREPARPPRSDSLTGMASSEFANKMNTEFDFTSMRPAPAPAPRAEAPAVPPMPEEPAAPPPQSDRNLAEMAQRLEAALRRPTPAEHQPPVTDPLAGAGRSEPRFEAPKFEAKPEPRPEPKFEPPRFETSRQAPKVEPKVESRPEFKPEPKLESKPEVKAEPKPDAKPAASNPFDSLEQEMANLLGRQPGKT